MNLEQIKLGCHCLASRVHGGYVIEASAFLCDLRHNQGQFVSEQQESHALPLAGSPPEPGDAP